MPDFTALVTPPKLVGPDMKPANGDIYVRSTNNVPKSGVIVIPFQAHGKIVNGDFRSLDDKPLMLVVTPEGVALEIFVDIVQEGPTGRRDKYSINRTVSVPNQSTVTWDALVDVVPVGGGTDYEVPAWVTTLLNDAVAAGTAATDAATVALDALAEIDQKVADVPTPAQLAATYERVIALVGRGVSHLETAAVNTPIIQAAIIEAEAAGAALVFPPTPAGSSIDINAKLTVSAGGIVIRGAGKHQTRIRQTAFPKPVFDILAANVTVEDMWLDQTAFSATAADKATLRGEPGTSFNSGVWAGAANIKVRNVHTSNLVCGVHYANYDVTADEWRTDHLSGGLVQNLSTDKVVFGLLAAGVDGFSFSGVRGNYRLTPTIATPPHLVYFSGNAGMNRNVTGTDCNATNGEYSYAYQFKGVTGGTFDKLSAQNTLGLLFTMDCTDLTFNSCIGLGDNTVATDYAAVEAQGVNSRIKINDLTLTMAASGKPFRFGPLVADSTLARARVVSNHTIAGLWSDYDVDIQGTRNTADDVTVQNVGTAPWGAGVGLWGGTGHTIRDPKTSGNSVGVGIRSSSITLSNVVDYDEREMGSTTNVPLAIPAQISGLSLSRRGTFASAIGLNRVVAYEDGSARTLTVAPSGHTWTKVWGTWAADGSRIYSTGGTPASTATLDVATADVDASVGVKLKAGEALAIRVIGRNDLIGVRVHTSGAFQLYKRVAAVETVLATSPVSAVAGRRYELRVVAYGNDLTAYLDGGRLLTHTLSAGDITTFGAITKHGLFGGGDVDGKFDNFVLRSVT